MPRLSETDFLAYTAEFAEVLRRVHASTGDDAAATAIDAMQLMASALKPVLGEGTSDSVIAAIASELQSMDTTTLAVAGLQKRKRDFT